MDEADKIAAKVAAMHRDPRFWAVWVAIWLGLLLAIENIITKVELLTHLGS